MFENENPLSILVKVILRLYKRAFLDEDSLRMTGMYSSS